MCIQVPSVLVEPSTLKSDFSVVFLMTVKNNAAIALVLVLVGFLIDSKKFEELLFCELGTSKVLVLG